MSEWTGQQWSKTAPARSGWYWIMVDEEVSMVRVMLQEGDRLLFVPSEDRPISRAWSLDQVQDMGALWVGPIEPPAVQVSP